jgi:thymidylate kinase
MKERKEGREDSVEQPAPDLGLQLSLCAREERRRTPQKQKQNRTEHYEREREREREREYGWVAAGSRGLSNVCRLECNTNLKEVQAGREQSWN